MESARVRLDREFTLANDRFRRMAAPAALEQLLGRTVDGVQFADEVDEIQAHESLEIGLATRALLAARVGRLASALARLATDEYGICIACGERIRPARLRALPEIETCIQCQDRLELAARKHPNLQAGPVKTPVAVDECGRVVASQVVTCALRSRFIEPGCMGIRLEESEPCGLR